LDSSHWDEHTLDTGRQEVRRLVAKGRAAVSADLRAHLPSDWRIDREYAGRHELHHRPRQPHAAACERHRDLPRVAADKDRLVLARYLERNVASGVGGPDDEHRAPLQLLQAAIFERVELPDARVERITKRWLWRFR
jgi:hypothetical protein